MSPGGQLAANSWQRLGRAEESTTLLHRKWTRRASNRSYKPASYTLHCDSAGETQRDGHGANSFRGDILRLGGGGFWWSREVASGRKNPLWWPLLQQSRFRLFEQEVVERSPRFNKSHSKWPRKRCKNHMKGCFWTQLKPLTTRMQWIPTQS